MNIIGELVLIRFYKKHEDAENSLNSWRNKVIDAHCSTPLEFKKLCGKGLDSKGNKYIMDITGKKYKLYVTVDYSCMEVYIKKVTDHDTYDRLNKGDIFKKKSIWGEI